MYSVRGLVFEELVRFIVPYHGAGGIRDDVGLARPDAALCRILKICLVIEREGLAGLLILSADYFCCCLGRHGVG